MKSENMVQGHSHFMAVRALHCTSLLPIDPLEF